MMTSATSDKDGLTNYPYQQLSVKDLSEVLITK